MKTGTIKIAHRIKAMPAAEQEQWLNTFLGHTRKITNVLLGINNHRLALVRAGVNTWEDFNSLDDELTRIKQLHEYAYLYDAPADSLQQAVKYLNQAIAGAINHRARAPKFKKKNAYRQAFTVTNQKGSVIYRGPKAFFKCPKLKKLCGNDLIPLAESPRFKGKIMSYTVIREGSDWYVTIAFELESNPHTCKNPSSVCGVDVGIKTSAVCSDGTELHMPDTSGEEAKIRHYQHRMGRSRHVDGRNVSNNYKKTQKKFRALQKRINNKRKDAIHKFTHEVTNNHGTVVIESLDVQKMIRKLPGRGARRSAYRACMGEVLRQLSYKARCLKKAPWYYASSQLCSVCGHRIPMPLNQRTYVCPHCGLVIDRDLNAAINLANYISQRGQR